MEVINHLSSVKYRVLFDPSENYDKNYPKDIKIVKDWHEFYIYLRGLRKNVL